MKITRDPDSKPIGLTEWGLHAQESFNQVVDNIIREGIECAMANKYQPFAHMPIMDAADEGAKIPDDPSTITVQLPLGENDDDHPSWTFTFTEMVEDVVESHAIGGPGGKIDPEAKSLLQALRAKLAEITASIDKALAR